MSKTDLAPALMSLGKKNKQVPKQDNQIFLSAMKAGKDMSIRIVFTAVSSALRIAPSI